MHVPPTVWILCGMGVQEPTNLLVLVPLFVGRCIAGTIVLSRIFRQKSSDMVTALNKIRIGICDQEVEDILSPCLCPGTIDAATAGKGLPASKQKRASSGASTMKTESSGTSKSHGSPAAPASETSQNSQSAGDDEIEPTILHSHNAVVDRVNNQRLAMIKSPPHVYKVLRLHSAFLCVHCWGMGFPRHSCVEFSFVACFCIFPRLWTGTVTACTNDTLKSCVADSLELTV